MDVIPVPPRPSRWVKGPGKKITNQFAGVD